MNKRFLKSLDYFFVLRPTLFFPVWTISLAGYWAQQRYGLPTNEMELTILGYDVSAALLILLLTLAMGASFLINQITDVETDRLNKKLYLIANGDISARNAYIQVCVLLILSLIFILIYRIDLTTVMLAAFLITGWAYSCRPLLFKDKPLGGIFANFFGGLLIFFFGWMIKSAPNLSMVLHSLPYAFGVLAIYFFTTVPDLEGDRAAGKITPAVQWGKGRVLRAGLVALLLAILIGATAKDLVIFIPTILIVPFFIYTIRKNTIDEVLRTNKFATLFLSLIICYRFPLYILLIAAIFFFSKWYYKARFNIRYPSLRT